MVKEVLRSFDISIFLLSIVLLNQVGYVFILIDEEKKLKQKRQKLASMKDNRIKAVMPDMDGKPVYVRSEEEKKLCFVLSSLGLKFRYEEAYEHQVLDEYHSQYRPKSQR